VVARKLLPKFTISENDKQRQAMTSDQFIYPWMQQQWQYVLQRFQTGQMPHALLLSGPSGLGKLQFALRAVDFLLCRENKNLSSGANPTEPCGNCQGCRLLAAGTHPDFKLIMPEEEGKQIAIDRIREVSGFLTLKSQYADLQIVIIAPAEAMNTYAANSLLKSLEEPTPQTLLLLVSSQPSRLLPTIRSRCQNITFNRPEFGQALDWLQSQPEVQTDATSLLTLADGAPLLGLDYARSDTLQTYHRLLISLEKIAKKQADPVGEAKAWELAGLAHSLKWLYFWVSNLIRLKLAGTQVDIAHNNTWQDANLAFLAERINSQELYGFLDKIVASFRYVNTSANSQLVLEDLLITWDQMQFR